MLQWPLLAQIINFLVLLWILGKLSYKPLVNTLGKRRQRVESLLKEATRLREEAESLNRQASQRLQGLEAEISALRQQIESAAHAEGQRMVAEAEARAQRMQQEADFVIAQQLKQMRIDLSEQAAQMAIQTAEALLRSSLGPEDQQRLAREYLSTLHPQERKPVVESRVSP